ncbi:MAG: tRNA (guanosine(46)-N7)-methyltransferase TrmB [Crocinitomicaceae bacterium]
MAKKKLIRFKDIQTMDFVVEPTMDQIKNDSFHLKGKWRKEIFKNDHPIVLELGCGKGEYAVGLGKKYPNKNFIGVDIKGARIWYGANTVREENLKNIAFLRTRIDFIEAFFAENEIDEIWLTFSDPQPKKPRKRLTSRLFTERYMKFLKPGGIVHVKTDSSWLFASTLEQIEKHNYPLIQKTWDLYGELVENLDSDTQEILSIRTHYEQIFSEKGFDIKYVKYKIH